MVAYSNLTAGRQTFYLAQIEAQHAGKTMQITLHDPGDVSGNAYLRILSPNGNAYNYATFSYSATNGRNGTSVNVIQTASGGTSYYDNQQITILIPLPTNYGPRRPPAARRDRRGLVEDRVRGQRRQRHHHVAGRHPRQPGAPGALTGPPDPTGAPGRPARATNRLPARTTDGFRPVGRSFSYAWRGMVIARSRPASPIPRRADHDDPTP